MDRDGWIDGSSPRLSRLEGLSKLRVRVYRSAFGSGGLGFSVNPHIENRWVDR